MEAAYVDKAVALAGLTLPPDVDFEVIGSDPILRSPHYLANGAAVARLLTGVGANELWRVRTGRTQRLVVDARHAAAALRSYMYVTYADESKRPAVNRAGGNLRLTRIIPTRDGRYVQLHGSFNDGPSVLAELGLAPDAESATIDAAVAERDAFELEDALIAREVCGGVVRSRDEWAAHPQGVALADLPVVTITRIGDAPPTPLPAGDRPASGIRVLDLTRVLAGPTCAKTFAEHGADVLHVSAPHLERGGLFDVETGIGKRQAHLDLRDPKQAATLQRLAADSDVFLQGYRLGALARRGLGPEALAERRPGIVYVSENCYGHVGPWAQRPGWEQLGQAATGMSHREGAAADGVPRLAPAAVNDYSTGYLAAYGAMLALARRATEGGSWLVQTSLSQTCMWYQRLGDDNEIGAAELGDVSAFLAQANSPDYGRLSYLAPALGMSETPPRWDLPPARHGAHDAVWLPRSERV